MLTTKDSISAITRRTMHSMLIRNYLHSLPHLPGRSVTPSFRKARPSSKPFNFLDGRCFSLSKTDFQTYRRWIFFNWVLFCLGNDQPTVLTLVWGTTIRANKIVILNSEGSTACRLELGKEKNLIYPDTWIVKAFMYALI